MEDVWTIKILIDSEYKTAFEGTIEQCDFIWKQLKKQQSSSKYKLYDSQGIVTKRK